MFSQPLPSVGRPNTSFWSTGFCELSPACLLISGCSLLLSPHLLSKHTQVPCPSPCYAGPPPTPIPLSVCRQPLIHQQFKHCLTVLKALFTPLYLPVHRQKSNTYNFLFMKLSKFPENGISALLVSISLEGHEIQCLSAGDPDSWCWKLGSILSSCCRAQGSQS